MKPHGCVPRNPSLQNQVVSWRWQEALGYEMETEKIPKDWVKARKGLDLTPVTSVRDSWNIPEEPFAACLCLSYHSLCLYSLFHTIVRRFLLNWPENVSGGFSLEHKAPSKLSNDHWNVSSSVPYLLHVSCQLRTRQHLKFLRIYLANIISIYFPCRLLSSCEMLVLDI